MAINLDERTLEELEKESKAPALIPDGTICDFEVLREIAFSDKVKYTEETTSSTGKPMLIAVLNVFHNDKTKVIIVYLTEGNSNYEKWKNKSFAATLGVKELSADSIIGKGGKCKIGIEKSDNPQYGDKNIVTEFVVAAKAVEVDLDDEIPFA